jgi:hypothetical protein
MLDARSQSLAACPTCSLNYFCLRDPVNSVGCMKVRPAPWNMIECAFRSAPVTRSRIVAVRRATVQFTFVPIDHHPPDLSFFSPKRFRIPQPSGRRILYTSVLFPVEF